VVSVSSIPMISGKALIRAEKEERAQAFETESIVVRPPDVVKGPPHLPKLEIYPVFLISENINCARARLSQLGQGLRLVGPIHKCRKSRVEVGILHNRKPSVVVVIRYNEVPKNVGQPKRAD
jgi:hypothetical protein